jgi:elongation factor P hydroxylase
MTPITKTPQTIAQDIVRLLDGSYSVASRTKTLVFYTVSPGEYGWACTCDGYAYRKSCYHVARTIEYDAQFIAERVKARTAHLPTPPVNNRPKLQLEDLWAEYRLHRAIVPHEGCGSTLDANY